VRRQYSGRALHRDGTGRDQQITLFGQQPRLFVQYLPNAAIEGVSVLAVFRMLPVICHAGNPCSSHRPFSSCYLTGLAHLP